jgi:hypothetical protein
MVAPPAGSQRLQVRLETALYPPSELTSCSTSTLACVAELYVTELTAALELPSGLLVVRESSGAAGGGATATATAGDGAAAVVLLDLLPEPAGDLGSLSPDAQLERMRTLVLRATQSSNRALRATAEITRLRPPHGSAEAFVTAAEVAAARRGTAVSAAVVAIVGAALLMGIAAFGFSRTQPSIAAEYQTV